MLKVSYSIEPKIWGKYFWSTMEAVAVNWDVSDPNSTEYVALFFISLEGTIPCSVCRNHYVQYMAENPIQNALENKETLFKWLLHLRNSVNKKLGQEEIEFSVFLETISNKFQLVDSVSK